VGELLRQAAWSPVAAGIGIGILALLCFLLSDKPLACSTSFARTSGMIERLLRGDRVLRKDYYRKFPPVIDWQWMLVAGIFAGALLSSLLSGTFRLEWVPAAWAGRFGETVLTRQLAAFAGGVLLGLGARWANGCTSGHGMSGIMQNAVSSWLATLMFFAGGAAAAAILYGKAG